MNSMQRGKNIWAKGLVVFLCLCCHFALSHTAGHAASLKALESNLKKEQSRAAERKKSIEQLTQQERQLHTDLVAAEKRIQALEAGIEEYQNKLEKLAGADAGERTQYEALLVEQKRTEEALTENLTFLWELAGKQIVTGKRDMADWAAMDREQTWAVHVYDALEKYRKTLSAQEEELARVLGRRQTISEEFKGYLGKVEQEKAKLLQARVSYSNRIASLRKTRVDTEAELKKVLDLVQNLQLQIQRQAGAIKNMKGKLPWPVAGRIERRFNPSATPPFNGVGIRTAEGSAVRAVAAGVVVHNDIMRGLGKVVVLQHDEEYYTIYAYLRESALSVGKQVAAAEMIGSSGVYPDVGGSGIYFALRFGQKPINPQGWLRP